jgi:hypothetical protein
MRRKYVAQKGADVESDQKATSRSQRANMTLGNQALQRATGLPLRRGTSSTCYEPTSFIVKNA